MKTFIIHIKHLFIKILLVIVLSFLSIYSFAQTDTIPPDPGAIIVYNVQDLNFGAFTIGSSGGTVIIGTNGTRSVTGDVVALNLERHITRRFLILTVPRVRLFLLLTEQMPHLPEVMEVLFTCSLATQILLLLLSLL